MVHYESNARWLGKIDIFVRSVQLKFFVSSCTDTPAETMLPRLESTLERLNWNASQGPSNLSLYVLRQCFPFSYFFGGTNEKLARTQVRAVKGGWDTTGVSFRVGKLVTTTAVTTRNSNLLLRQHLRHKLCTDLSRSRIVRPPSHVSRMSTISGCQRLPGYVTDGLN